MTTSRPTPDGKYLGMSEPEPTGFEWPNQLVFLARQCVEDSMRWFPDVSPRPGDSPRETLGHIIHHTLAMFGEAGEFANIVKKIERGSLDFEDEEVQFDLRDELADVLIYLLNLAGLLGIDLTYAYNDKRERNEARFGHATP